ncbi:MAG: hypothetical protein LUE31_08550 [Lachnospiraceae bacterium]|nr:hypothetical protein [Lachnospiraceae bacterium]
MKTRKTRTDARGTFTYKFADGTSVVLTPGVDGVTEADIAMLHRMDDREVENNVKQSRSPIEDWEKPIIAEWKEQNPGEIFPPKYHASLDYFDSANGEDMDSDQSHLFADCAVEMDEAVPEDVVRLREIVDKLPEKLAVIYRRVMIEGESTAKVAKDLEIEKKTVYNRMNKIRQIIRHGFL